MRRHHLLPVLLALAASAAAAACARPPAAVGISVPYELDTLDPHARNLQGLLALTANAYEPLVAHDADMALRPRLATSWHNPDPQTWVFVLRRDVVFHDGQPLTADDVVATFERLRAHPELQLGLYAREVIGARALDGHTVELRTARPLAVFLNQLALVPIVRRHPSAADLTTAAAGTGPYRIVRSSADTLEMERFDGYWGARPPLPRVLFRLRRSGTDALDDVRAGRSQIAQVPASTRVDGDPGLALQRRPGFAVRYLGFDVARSSTPFVAGRPNPFLDPRVRRAIALALDRQAIAAGLGEPATATAQLAPPTIFGAPPAAVAPAPRIEEAQALMREAGLGDGFTVTLHERRSPGGAAPPIAQSLDRIGVHVDVREVPDSDFFRFADDPPSLFITRWGCDTGDISDMLEAVFHSLDRERHLGLANLGRYADPEVDAEIEASAEDLDVVHRHRRLDALVARLLDANVIVPLYLPEEAWVVRRGYTWHPRADGYVLASEISN